MLALFKALGALMPAVTIVNALGGIVGTIWAVVAGDWWALGYMVLIFVAAEFVISILLIPSFALGAIGAGAIEKQAVPAGRILFALGSLYISVVMAGWAILISSFFLTHTRNTSLLPILLLAYGASTGPWAYMATKDQRASGNEFSIIGVALYQAGYLVGGVLYLMQPDEAGLLALSVLVAVTINWIVQQVMLKEVVASAHRAT